MDGLQMSCRKSRYSFIRKMSLNNINSKILILSFGVDSTNLFLTKLKLWWKEDNLFVLILIVAINRYNRKTEIQMKLLEMVCNRWRGIVGFQKTFKADSVGS